MLRNDRISLENVLKQFLA